jgi:hypothetical protein
MHVTRTTLQVVLQHHFCLHIDRITAKSTTINTAIPPIINANGARGDKLITTHFAFIYPTRRCGFVIKKG